MHEEIMHDSAMKLFEDVTEILALDVNFVCKNLHLDKYSVLMCIDI